MSTSTGVEVEELESSPPLEEVSPPGVEEVVSLPGVEDVVSPPGVEELESPLGVVLVSLPGSLGEDGTDESSTPQPANNIVKANGIKILVFFI